MKDSTERGEALFSQHFRLAEKIVRKVSRLRRLSDDDSQELYSLVMLKLVRDDYAVLRGFRGRSSWKTFLTVVVQRVLLDHRVKEWGRWRPSAGARRLGDVAVELERRIHRDGLAPSEAIHELAIREVDSAEKLEKLAKQLPWRPPWRPLTGGESHLDHLADTSRADTRVEDGERQREASRLKTVLTSVLRALPSAERELLSLRFGRGWTVRRIAASRGVGARALYQHFYRIFQRIRRELEHLDLGWPKVAEILESQDLDLEIGSR